MRVVLIAFYVFVLAAMVGLTTWASLERNVLDNGALMADRWFVATLADAYFGFFSMCLWIAVRERTWLARIGWIVAVLLLGNITFALYVLVQLVRMKPGETWQQFLLGRPPMESH